jgi:ribosome-associated protein
MKKKKSRSINKSEKTSFSADILLEIITEAAEKKKACEVSVLNIGQASSVADYFVIISAESGPQLKAIADEISVSLHNKGIKGFRIEGNLKSGWIVIDLGYIVIHMMGIKERSYYNLGELWGNQGITYHL